MPSNLTHPPKQIRLHLPDELAAKLARAVPLRQRNRYILNLVERDLAAKQRSENRLLAKAAERMNEIEAQYPELAQEAQEWVNAELTESVDLWDPDFDRETFERESAIAQAARRSGNKSRRVIR